MNPEWWSTRPLQEERAVVDLLKLYMNEELVGKEGIVLDPEPTYSGDQIHIWFHSNIGATYPEKLWTYEMIGWFHVKGKIVQLATFTKLPWEDRGPSMVAHINYDVSDPSGSALKAELRAAINRARRYLGRRTTHGK